MRQLSLANVPTLVAEVPGAEADRPLLTYCDDATGERTDLTAAALGGWAARTASLLRDGCGLTSGDRAAGVPADAGVRRVFTTIIEV